MEQSRFWKTLERVGIAYGFIVAMGSVMTGLSRWADGNSWTLSIVIGLATISFLTYLYERLRPRLSELPSKLLGTHSSPLVAVEQTAPVKPFLVRFVERQQDCRGVLWDDNEDWVLKIEVVNATGRHVDKLEVYITGETSELNANGLRRSKIAKQYLKNRRGVDHLNAGQSEEYVLVSIQNDPPLEWWGDYKLAGPGERERLETDAQHIVEITVLSSSTPRLVEKLVVINTYNRQVLPVWPGPTKWILNTRGPKH